MIGLPISSHASAAPSSAQLRDVARLVATLRAEQPGLDPGADLEALRVKRLGAGPSLHLDDFTAITLPERYGSIAFLEDRARLRASDGDLLATTIQPAKGYEQYCRQNLGLGRVEWVQTHPLAARTHLATRCWTDADVRARLQRADIRYIHPHMGSFAAWALAALLSRTRRTPIRVIAPPPPLTRATNDKLWFSDVVERLFGRHWIPRTMEAANLATLSHVVRSLAAQSDRLVIKLPDAVGGGGNLVLDSSRFRGLELGCIRNGLRDRLSALEWRGDCKLLVSSWETEVLSAPSAQLWLPPVRDGEPVVEGLFEQVIEGREGYFVGSRPARLPEPLIQEMATRAWLLGLLFQRLGYVGRCSFDLLLVGPDTDSCRIEFLECNGRWGGTSSPMTLMNRVLGDWANQPFASLECDLGTKRWCFADLVSRLGVNCFDRRTGSGDFILYNPGGLSNGQISVIGLGAHFADRPRRIRERLSELVTNTPLSSQSRHESTIRSNSLRT